MVKKITFTVDDETYRRARVKAAERDTSVSALVRQFLVEMASAESEGERLKRQEIALRAAIGDFRAEDQAFPRRPARSRRMSVRRFIDTNVLLYSISTAENEAAKRERARALLDEDDCGLSVQVLQEFYVQATRPTRSDPLAHDIAAGLIRAWTRFSVQDNTLGVMNTALDIKAAHGFSYWDSAIIAAAVALGCSELCTEDMSHGRRVEGVTIIDPFR